MDGDSSMAYRRLVTLRNRNSLCRAIFLGEKFGCDVFWSLLFRYVPWTSNHPKHGRNDVSNEAALPGKRLRTCKQSTKRYSELLLWTRRSNRSSVELLFVPSF